MNYDELAFVNQQLAGMLKCGIPLEGALRQLCATMKTGTLREELQRLEADLAKGIPLAEAVGARKLPEFYVRMVEAGVQGNDLPEVLLLVADYYSKVNVVWTRLKALMIYPLLVLLTATTVSTVLALILRTLVVDSTWLGLGDDATALTGVTLFTWVPVFGLSAILLAVMVAGTIPSLRRSLRWRLPGFQEASIAQFASSMSLLLRNGSGLNDSLGLLQQMEAGSPIGKELGQWRSRLGDGHAKIGAIIESTTAFPPLFVWLLESVGEDLGAGFQRAADMYRARALYRVELLLHVALPLAMITLGLMIICQLVPVIRAFMHVGGGLVTF